MEILGYAAAVLIGLSLGLIGGGGSILTIPVLVYFFRISPPLATSYSLFVVGFTSMIGAYNSYRQRQVHVSAVLLFGFSSILTVLFTRLYLMPAIPETILTVAGFTLTRAMLTMVLLAVLMIAAAVFMIRPQQLTAEQSSSGPYQWVRLFLYGMGLGLVTGLLGAGGGFLLIPALIMVVRLPMKKAVGTSLLIITLNSLIGFAGDFGQYPIDWPLLFRISLLAAAGIFLGGFLGRKIDHAPLKKMFGWFVMAMGVYILITELIR